MILSLGFNVAIWREDTDNLGKGFTMNENTRKTFASFGLERLKRAVLDVLYDQQTSGETRRLRRRQICQRFGISAPKDRVSDNVPRIQGILYHLREEGHVESNAVNRWRITPEGVSVIEDG